ncbi:MAG: MFS transporter [Pseudomonadota bacterium]|nr:MFS transporter [Pseudomonadota bacterium]
MKDRAHIKLSLRVLLAYILPAFVIALPTIPVYIHLPALYGIKFGLGLATVGFVLLAARIFDTVSDPIVGILSDRLNFRGAHRKPWIALGSIIAAAGLLKVLNPPPVIDSSYLLCWSIVLYTGWTLVAVPYLTWGAELSGDYNERARITSWREGSALIGILFTGAISAIAPSLGWDQQEALIKISWFAIGLGAFSIPIMLWTVPDKSKKRVVSPRLKTTVYISNLKTIFYNKPFLLLLSAWFINGLANGIPAALFLIYLEHGLGANHEIRPLFILIYFLSAVTAIPMWIYLSRIFGKHRAWCWAMILASAAFITVPIIPPESFKLFATICIITGMALGADLALPPAIQADVVDYDRWRFNEERAGVQFAIWGMSTKLSLAIAVGLALPGLEALGFNPKDPTTDGVNYLVAIYSLAPVLIKISAVVLIWRFPINKKKHRIITQSLKRSHLKHKIKR